MIHRTAQRWQTETWQESLSNAIRCPRQLRQLLKLEQLPFNDGILASEAFSVMVPKPYLNRIKPGDINDPLLRQVMPDNRELIKLPEYSKDPLQENDCTPLPGLIHKYHGRILLVTSGGCAINCRYCFRRHFDYNSNTHNRTHLEKTIEYITDNPEISEVILSGGDPLAAKDNYLKDLCQTLGNLPQLKRLRIHTRLPVVIPQRINAECLDWLSASKLPVVMVLHCNHPNEIDQEVHKAITDLKHANVTMLNQSVLLRGVNDDVDTLIDLSETLFASGVLPYYLHLLDPVEGSSLFEVDEIQARTLVGALIAQLPGYLVPKFVKECAKTASKFPIAPIF